MTFLQLSLNSNSSLLLSAEERPGISTPQATATVDKKVNSLKLCSQAMPNKINNNTNNGNSLPKKHQQTVRFIAGHKNGKSKLKTSVVLAESEETIASDEMHSKRYGNPQHVRMMVNLTCLVVSCLVHFICLLYFASHFIIITTLHKVTLEESCLCSVNKQESVLDVLIINVFLILGDRADRFLPQPLLRDRFQVVR